jgi:hypothetical protein
MAHALVLTRVQTFNVQPPSQYSSFRSPFLCSAMRASFVAMFLLVASAVTPAFSAPIEYAVGTCNLAIFTDFFAAFVRTPLPPSRATGAQAGDGKVKIPSFARYTDLFVAVRTVLSTSRATGFLAQDGKVKIPRFAIFTDLFVAVRTVLTPSRATGALARDGKVEIPSFYAMATSARWGCEIAKNIIAGTHLFALLLRLDAWILA